MTNHIVSKTVQYPGIMRISEVSAQRLIGHIDTHDDSPYNVVQTGGQYWSVSPVASYETLLRFWKEQGRIPRLQALLKGGEK